MIPLLQEYKTWWMKQKIHGDGEIWERSDRLFVQANGNNMSGSTISKWLKEFQIKNNLKQVTAHGLRHTYVSMLVVSGTDPKTVSELAGHAEIQTTLKYYTHTNFKAKREAADKVSSMLNPHLKPV